MNRQRNAKDRAALGRRDAVLHRGAPVPVIAIEEAMTAWPAVTVAGASYHGFGLPDCVTQAHVAATRMGEWAGTHRPVPLVERTPA